MNSPASVQLIAVVGGSGAGKGWLVSRLCALLGDAATHLQLDDFYRDRSHLPPARRTRVNFDAPHAIDWEWAARVLRACRSGRRAEVPRYDFTTHCRLTTGRTWEPKPLVFVDGLWLLRPPEVRNLFELKLYLDTPRELRRSRRMVRDVAERGYTADAVAQRLRELVEPMHDRYVEPQKRWADLVLRQPFEEAQLAELADRLWILLQRAELVDPWMHETFRAELLTSLASHEYSH